MRTRGFSFAWGGIQLVQYWLDISQPRHADGEASWFRGVLLRIPGTGPGSVLTDQYIQAFSTLKVLSLRSDTLARSGDLHFSVAARAHL